MHILNARNGLEVQALIGHENAVYRVSFSPDGRQVATVELGAYRQILGSDYRNCPFHPAPTYQQAVAGPLPIWDFDFRCTGPGLQWIAVPLTAW